MTIVLIKQKFIKTFKNNAENRKETRKITAKHSNNAKIFQKLLDGKIKSAIMHSKSIGIKTQTMEPVKGAIVCVFYNSSTVTKCKNMNANKFANEYFMYFDMALCQKRDFSCDSSEKRWNRQIELQYG